MTVTSLLPPRNATAFMRALEQVVGIEGRVLSGVELIANIKGRQLPSFVQFLLYEYGLIELTPYVENPYTLLAEGRRWQIERDTLAAIHRGLGWVENPATIEEAPTRRNWWNSFQLRFQALPANDTPMLDRIDRVTQLGKPFRSDFRRGVFGYDAPAAETDGTRLDACLLDQESGVRLRDGGPLWSFGRTIEYAYNLTREEGVALGNYVTPTGEQSVLIDFQTGEVQIAGVDVPMSQAATYVRPSPKTATDLSGELVDFTANEPAITDRGYLFEPSSSNAIPNNGDGSLWNFPPAWEGLTVEIIDQDVVDGIAYSDFRVHGTTTDQRGLFIAFSNDIPAAAGSLWTASAYVAVVGGSTAGLENFSLSGVDISGVGSTLQRVSVSAAALVGGLSPGLQFGYDLGAVIDVTVRVAYPQIEPGDRMSSVIKTGAVAATRAADQAIIHLPTGIHNVTIVFDDDTSDVLEGRVGDVVLAPNYARRIIKRITAFQLHGFESLRWQDLNIPWSAADFPWVSPDGNARRILMATWFRDRVGYLALLREDGSVIGYRRARAVKQVNPTVGGQYVVGGVAYKAVDNGEFVVLDAMTDAGNGAGEIAASVAFAFNGTLALGVPPGKLWLTPTELSGAVLIAAKPAAVPLRNTVRDRVKILLRF